MLLVIEHLPRYRTDILDTELIWFGMCGKCKTAYVLHRPLLKLGAASNASSWYPWPGGRDHGKPWPGHVRSQTVCQETTQTFSVCEGRIWQLADQPLYLAAWLVGGPAAIRAILEGTDGEHSSSDPTGAGRAG